MKSILKLAPVFLALGTAACNVPIDESASCVSDNLKVENNDLKQRFKIVDNQTNEIRAFTGKNINRSSDGNNSRWDALTPPKDENGLPTYGWEKNATWDFVVKLSDNGKIERCEIGPVAYKAPSFDR